MAMAMAMAMASGSYSPGPLSITPISEPLCHWSHPLLLSSTTIARTRKQKTKPVTLPLSRAQSNSSSSEPSSSSSSSSSSSASSPSPSSEKQKDGETINQTPSWAQPGSTEPPPWEKKASISADSSFELPFYFYLLASGIVAIAAIGSIFEYTNKKPIFGVIFPDSALYTPILGFFAITGFPSAAFLWFKSISLANKAAREQDQEDGFYD